MLTKKEKEVLELRKKGLKQSEIASKLNISQPAVSSFVSNSIRKMQSAKRIMEYAKYLDFDFEEEE